MKNNLLPHFALLGASTIYGINYIVAKEVMPAYVEPFGFILIRALGAGALFWLVGLVVRERVEKRDFIRLFFSAIFGVAINQMMFFKGLNLTTPINASIIMVSNPIIVLIIASILIKEKITSRKIIGILMGSLGAIFLIAYGKELTLLDGDVKLGNFLVLINAISYGLYLVIVKPLIQKYHPFTITKWVFLFGGLMVFPFSFEEFSRIDWSNMPTEMLWRIAYVVLFTSFFAYLLNVYALKTLKPSTVSFYIYLQPLIASVISIAKGLETFGPVELISAAFIFTGVYLVSVNKKRDTLQAPR